MPPKRKRPASNDEEAKKAKIEFDLVWKDFGKKSSKGDTPMFALYSTSLPGRNKIAAFDIDWTVIATASGRKFATGASDWKWLNDEVPKRLKKLHEDGFRVVFISNQGGIEKNKVTVKEIQKKTASFIEALKIPIFAFFCTGENHYRKPSTWMWDELVKNCNGGVEVDLNQSFYIGDAAGRAKNWAPGKPRDFSSSDRLFAANIGIDFKTPEEFFEDEEPAPFSWPVFDPQKFLAENEEVKKLPTYHSDKQEIIILVGMPASGKSHFYQTFFQPNGYVHVNRDTLGTPAKCLKTSEAAISEGKSVVVDNTNPSKAGRAEYIQLAKKNKIPCRCFHLSTPREMAAHLNFFRQNLTEGRARRIPDVGYNVFLKNFQEPSLAEGFQALETIQFRPQFPDQKHRQLFSNWT